MNKTPFPRKSMPPCEQAALEIVGICHDLGLSHEQVARLLGVSSSTIGRWRSAGYRPEGLHAALLPYLEHWALRASSSDIMRLRYLLQTRGALTALAFALQPLVPADLP